MSGHLCTAVPPYILQALAEAPEANLREMAISTLAMSRKCHHDRYTLSLDGQGGGSYPGDDSGSQLAPQAIVPDYILEDVTSAEGLDDDVRGYAKDTLDGSRQMRYGRVSGADSGHDAGSSTLATAVPSERPVFSQEIFDMEHKDNLNQLPGTKSLWMEGGAASKDPAANEVHDNTAVVLKFFWDVFQYASVDGANQKITSSVHYDTNYGNAAWYVNRTETVKQMIYGDGDGKVLVNFTRALDVIGHEFTHGITHFNSKLQYENESGALNEHLSDVFGILVKQKAENKKADEADWLIGEACFLPEKKGTALRNMLRPGTAYKSLGDVPGRDDPQPDHYSKIAAVKQKFPRLKGTGVDADFGGVHYFSGIPNRAFALCALKFGGFAWEKAGKIWWTASIVKKTSIPQSCTFIQFADVTVEAAKELHGADAAKIVRDAWNEVGVVRAH